MCAGHGFAISLVYPLRVTSPAIVTCLLSSLQSLMRGASQEGEEAYGHQLEGKDRETWITGRGRESASLSPESVGGDDVRLQYHDVERSPVIHCIVHNMHEYCQLPNICTVITTLNVHHCRDFLRS